MDKFLTDLAACEGAADIVNIGYRAWYDHAERFEVKIGHIVPESDAHPYGWSHFYGTGPTVDAAMADARARRAAALSALAELDGEMIGEGV